MSVLPQELPATLPAATPLLAGMRRRPTATERASAPLTDPRLDPYQWHRRGLRSPDEIAAIVAARLAEPPHPESALPSADGANYGDFFLETSA